MGNLIQYTLYLENAPLEVKTSLREAIDRFSYTGAECNEDSTVITFFLETGHRLEDYITIPPNCRVATRP